MYYFHDNIIQKRRKGEIINAICLISKETRLEKSDLSKCFKNLHGRMEGLAAGAY